MVRMAGFSALLLALSFFYFCFPPLSSAKEVIQLNSDNFDQEISSGTWLVVFYSLNCKFSRGYHYNFLHMVEKANDNINYGRVDIIRNPDLFQRFLPKAVPKLFFFKDGTMRIYEGTKSRKLISEFTSYGYIDVEPLPIPPKQFSISTFLTLEEKQFDAMVSQGRWFVEFGAPWCSHCEEFLPILQNVSKRIENTDIKILRIDGSKIPSLIEKYDLQGFPSLFLFSNGKAYPCSSREENGIVTFLESEITTLEPFEPIPPKELPPIEELLLKFEHLKTVGRNNFFGSFIGTSFFFFLVGILYGKLLLRPRGTSPQPNQKKTKTPNEHKNKPKKQTNNNKANNNTTTDKKNK